MSRRSTLWFIHDLAKFGLRWLLSKLYRVEISGIEHLNGLGERVIIVANHTSFLDGLLLYCFLPFRISYAINTRIARGWYVTVVKWFVGFFPLDPANPLSLRTLIQHLRNGSKVVIFPEGRITVTGTLMKIYNGPGLVAIKSGAQVLPIAIEGAHYTPFSRLKGKVRLRWFPRIRLTIMPPRVLTLASTLGGRDQREHAGHVLSELTTNMVFAAVDTNATLFERLLEARIIHGGDHVIAEDTERAGLSYNDIVTRSLVLGRELARLSQRGQYIGIMLPTSIAALVSFFALHVYGRIPAMLNYSAGRAGVVSALHTAGITRVLTSRKFVEKAGLSDLVSAVASVVTVLYVEDIAANISFGSKLRALMFGKIDSVIRRKARHKLTAESPAVLLFTSGSEGAPKGVVLSHKNLLANIAQLNVKIDFNAQDVVLNAMPLFHAFGLTGGTLLPLFSGMKCFYYPSPLHYRVIPEIAYDINATCLFGTNTFLAGYGHAAHPYDFFSVRYVFAGAEKLRDDVRLLWQQKFGLRVLEGYGATECSPVLATNTPMEYRPGTVGRFLPGIEYSLEPVAGLEVGGRLFVRGPNVMSGYLLPSAPGELHSPSSSLGKGWYDTGDIVVMDDDGFVTICGRAKRFAKIAGEMISLAMVEELVIRRWPEANLGAIAIADDRKGEQIVLVTDMPEVERGGIIEEVRQRGLSELYVPNQIVYLREVPLLGSGKVDLRALAEWVMTKSEVVSD